MNQEKFGQLIKEIRKKYNLTQKELAEKYSVTYQAVSKWENGKNMPDTSLIKQMSKDFGISLEEMFEGEFKEKKTKKNPFLLLLIIIFILLIVFIFFFIKRKENDFQFKTLSASCENFNIAGTISYNENKTAIYVTNIKYCGEEDKEEYQSIECVLYEKNEETEKIISSHKYDKEKTIKLDDFLQQVTLTVDNYTKTCKEFKDNSLYLLINALNKDNKMTTYKIPLKLEENCEME